MSFPTTDIVDNFNRVDVNSPPTGWTQNPWDGYGNFGVIISNQLGEAGLTGFSNYYNAQQFGSDCEAYVTVAVLPSSTGKGLYVNIRSTPASDDGYNVRASNGQIVLTKASGDLATFTQVLHAGDSFGISAIGKILTAWFKLAAGNWTALGTYDTSSDPVKYSGAGYIGLIEDSGDTTFRLDNFGGGTYVPPTASKGILTTRSWWGDI